jgi:hypothetical protein
MKNTLALSSLVIFAAVASAELVRAAGLQAPSLLNFSNGILAFSAVLLMQLLLADYGAKVRPIALPRSRPLARSLRRPSMASAYHHVYAVRRGTETARLATPNRAVTFPRRLPAHSQPVR